MTFWDLISLFLACTCLSLVIYSYLGFPAILWLLTRIKRFVGNEQIPESALDLPQVSLIVAAHNEQRNIKRKISNALEQTYPKDQLEIIIASDGSTDKTMAVAAEHAGDGIIVHGWPRAGKASAQNRSIELAKGDIIVFSDADTLLAPDFLEHLVSRFKDVRVGCVDGELCYVNQMDDGITRSEGLYWKVEMRTRRMLGQLGLLPFVSGACFGIRKKLYAPVAQIYDGDVICPMRVLGLGYHVVHEPKARAFDHSKAGMGPQLRARARVAMRSLAGVFHDINLLSPIKHPLISVVVFSHRLLRWWGPFLLITAFGASAVVAHHPLGGLLFISQILFYSMAVVGFFYEKLGYPVPIVSIPFSFVLANIGMLVGTTRWLLGRKMVTWDSGPNV